MVFTSSEQSTSSFGFKPEISTQSLLRNPQGEKIGSVTRFPVILAYAVTCHKSQGLELPGVVLHCSKEFVPGLIYVAMSRVKSQDTLQVLDFNQNQLQAADPEVIRQCSRDIGECDQSLNCCRRKSAVGNGFFDVRDRFDAEDSQDAAEDCYKFPIDVCDGLVQAYFESEDTEVDLNVAELFYQMENQQSELSRPPQEGFDLLAVLNALKVHTPGSEYSQMVNEALDCLKEPHLSKNLKAFVNVVWFHSFLALENHFVENPDELEVKVSKGDFFWQLPKSTHYYISPSFYSTSNVSSTCLPLLQLNVQLLWI